MFVFFPHRLLHFSSSPFPSLNSVILWRLRPTRCFIAFSSSHPTLPPFNTGIPVPSHFQIIHSPARLIVSWTSLWPPHLHPHPPAFHCRSCMHILYPLMYCKLSLLFLYSLYRFPISFFFGLTPPSNLSLLLYKTFRSALARFIAPLSHLSLPSPYLLCTTHFFVSLSISPVREFSLSQSLCFRPRPSLMLHTLYHFYSLPTCCRHSYPCLRACFEMYFY